MALASHADDLSSTNLPVHMVSWVWSGVTPEHRVRNDTNRIWGPKQFHPQKTKHRNSSSIYKNYGSFFQYIYFQALPFALMIYKMQSYTYSHSVLHETKQRKLSGIKIIASFSSTKNSFYFPKRSWKNSNEDICYLQNTSH